MTREQFLRGYMLLTTQPWGKAYREAPGASGEPSPAQIQAELYFQGVSAFHSDAWIQACTANAAGEHWPSLDTLKQAMKSWIPTQPSLGPPKESTQYCTKEEFGLNLYETIKTIGSLLAIDEHRAVAIHRGEPQTDLLGQRRKLQGVLAQQLPVLTDNEMAQVLDKYPFVTGY